MQQEDPLLRRQSIHGQTCPAKICCSARRRSCKKSHAEMLSNDDAHWPQIGHLIPCCWTLPNTMLLDHRLATDWPPNAVLELRFSWQSCAPDACYYATLPHECLPDHSVMISIALPVLLLLINDFTCRCRRHYCLCGCQHCCRCCHY